MMTAERRTMRTRKRDVSVSGKRRKRGADLLSRQSQPSPLSLPSPLYRPNLLSQRNRKSRQKSQNSSPNQLQSLSLPLHLHRRHHLPSLFRVNPHRGTFHRIHCRMMAMNGRPTLGRCARAISTVGCVR